MIIVFQCILAKTEERISIYLQTDKNKKFVTQSMQKFPKKNDIRFRVMRNPDVKAAIVERFNTTLKERMWHYFTHKNFSDVVMLLDSLMMKTSF